ncbi:NAD(P)/FAD-dependent oxidoreductase [Amycolatopsis suaedae]|uniref:FAD-dependent oxidoreductase n=1 Tax=Amycolatopsis suaedae TaxID=2510978 RepID=A0A4Q7JCS5_9PSEU|nr:FAD-dependent oxidoreductase [Amycolatopsis suaedae]RZQ64852.1 FAD-dependent oxidoreductase [Amycolatopsis suaedae]
MRVIVIGSGIGGASTAYQLARRGADVLVVDAGVAGAATLAGAGIVSPWTTRRDDAELRLAGRAAAFYPELVAQLAADGAPDCSYEVVGGMVVSADPADLDEREELLHRRAAEFPQAGTVRRVPPDQARELFPPLAPELGGVHVSGAGRVDGRVLRAALLDGAVRRGAAIERGRAELAGGKVLVDGRPEAADAVVVAAGAWSAELLAPLGVELPVAPQRGQISHLELPGTDTATWPVVLPPSSHYLLAFAGSRVVVGATRETGSGFDHRITAGGQHEVLDNALAVAPGLATATLLETRIGFRPASPDGLPLLGAVPGHPTLHVVTGFGPAGLTLAPYVGVLMAEGVLGEESEVDISALRPDRF